MRKVVSPCVQNQSIKNADKVDTNFLTLVLLRSVDNHKYLFYIPQKNSNKLQADMVLPISPKIGLGKYNNVVIIC